MEQFEQQMIIQTADGPVERKIDFYEVPDEGRRSRGMGLRGVPVLLPGEEIFWCVKGDCHVVQTGRVEEEDFSRGMSMPSNGFVDQEMIHEAYVFSANFGNPFETLATRKAELDAAIATVRSEAEAKRTPFSNTVNNYQTHPSESPELEREKDEEIGTGSGNQET